MQIARLTPPSLRTAKEEGKRTATWLELFYDLSFVVAVAVLGVQLHGNMSWGGVASFIGYFALIWWLWASHTFYADRFDTDDLVYRVLAATQMVAIVVIAASVSGEGSGSLTAFAVGYTLARLTLLALYWRVHRHVEEVRALVAGYLKGFGLGAIVWTASIFIDRPMVFLVWFVALTIDLATPWVMRSQQKRVPLDISHLPERFGLFTILVLGESIAAVVAGLGHLQWAFEPTLTAALGIGIATALWWMYFDNAEGSVVRRRDRGGKNWRPTAWIYTHFPLAATLAALGVSLETAVNEAGHGAMPAPERWLFVGSVAAAFASMALIQESSLSHPHLAINRAIAFNRLAAIPFVLLIGLFGGVDSMWITIGVFGVCIAEVVADLTLTAQSRAMLEATHTPEEEEAELKE